MNFKRRNKKYNNVSNNNFRFHIGILFLFFLACVLFSLLRFLFHSFVRIFGSVWYWYWIFCFVPCAFNAFVDCQDRLSCVCAKVYACIRIPRAHMHVFVSNLIIFLHSLFIALILSISLSLSVTRSFTRCISPCICMCACIMPRVYLNVTTMLNTQYWTHVRPIN